MGDPFPGSEEFYVFNDNSGGEIPRGSVFEHPAGELISLLDGGFGLGCQQVYVYFDSFNGASANRIKVYNVGSVCVSLVEDAKAEYNSKKYQYD